MNRPRIYTRYHPGRRADRESVIRTWATRATAGLFLIALAIELFHYLTHP